MRPDHFSDSKVIDSWRKNALPWTRAVRERQIESRRLCTDRAIIEAIASCSPQSAIDMGCGEGWLCRVLAEQGVKVLGIDAVPDLISAAQLAGSGDFRLLTYEEVVSGKLEIRADAVVCNFSLIGKEDVEGLIGVVPRLLNRRGSFVIQTLHPAVACGDGPHEDGWRRGSWDGFDAAFTDPAPWYFRTLESWERLLQDSGFQLREVREPTHPASGDPISILFIAQLAE